MADILGRLKSRRRVWLGAGGLLFVGLMLLAFARSDRGADDPKSMAHVVTEEAFVIQQSFSGRIVPGEQVEILSPSDATLVQTGFNFGDRVEEGQALFQLSESDVWRKNAEAQIGYLQAEDAAQKLENWNNGQEVVRARRALEAARVHRDEAQRRHDEGERLFARGLISRSEMENLAGTLRQSGQNLVSAEEDLSHTLSRGEGLERRVSEIQRGLAASRLREVTSGGSVITAPRSGIIVRAQTGAAPDGNMAKVGSKVSAGQSLGVIAVIDALDVLFRVDEADLALLEVGMPAVVTGPGFAGRRLTGTLLSLAGEAETGSSAEKIMFAARVRLDPLSADDAARLRIGMTGQIALTLYETPRALTVPMAALDRGRPRVQVRLPDGRTEARGIKLGRIGPDRAEVLDGVKAGETVVWTPSA